MISTVNERPFCLNAYEYVQTIGQGSFGSVRKYIRKDDRSDAKYPLFVAVKEIIQKKRVNVQYSHYLSSIVPPSGKNCFTVFQSENHHKYIKRERGIMEAISHPNIVKYFGHVDCETKHNFVTNIIMEMCSFDLSCLHGRLFLNHELGVMIWQVLRAINYLHEKDVIHRDIKPCNILVNVAQEDFDIMSISVRLLTLKLCDFGLARLVSRADSSRTMSTVGTQAYAAPEIRSNIANKVGLSDYTKSCDIFSAGIVIYEMATGKLLNDSSCDTDFVKLENSLNEIWCTGHLFSLLRCMLHLDKTMRSRPNHLLRHPFVEAGKEFYETGSTHKSQILADALETRLALNSDIKEARLQLKSLSLLKKMLSISGSALAIAGSFLSVVGSVIKAVFKGDTIIILFLHLGAAALSEVGVIAKLVSKVLNQKKGKQARRMFVKALEQDLKANNDLEVLLMTEQDTKHLLKKHNCLSIDFSEGLAKDLEPTGVATYDAFGRFHTLTLNDCPQKRLVHKPGSCERNYGDSFPYTWVAQGLSNSEIMRMAPGLATTCSGLLNIVHKSKFRTVIDAVTASGIPLGQLAFGVGTGVAGIEAYDLVSKANEKNDLIEFMSVIADRVERNLKGYPGLLEPVIQ